MFILFFKYNIFLLILTEVHLQQPLIGSCAHNQQKQNEIVLYRNIEK